MSTNVTISTANLVYWHEDSARVLASVSHPESTNSTIRLTPVKFYGGGKLQINLQDDAKLNEANFWFGPRDLNDKSKSPPAACAALTKEEIISSKKAHSLEILQALLSPQLRDDLDLVINDIHAHAVEMRDSGSPWIEIWWMKSRQWNIMIIHMLQDVLVRSAQKIVANFRSVSKRG